MAEYIEKGAAKYAVDLAMELSDTEYDAICNSIDKSHSADVAPVVHGRWVKQHIESVDSAEFSKCSVCNYPVSTMWNRTNYCPNCGAKMDGANDDG